jgi:hypothetical protein
VDLEAWDLTEDLVQASTWFGLADAFEAGRFATIPAGNTLQYPQQE